jgi:hypothetical protein
MFSANISRQSCKALLLYLYGISNGRPYLAVGRWDRSQRSVSDRSVLTGKGNRYLTENRRPRDLTRDRKVVGWWAFDAGWWAAIPFSRPSRVRNKIHLRSEIRTICYKNYSLYYFIVCRRMKKQYFSTISFLRQRYFRVKNGRGIALITTYNGNQDERTLVKITLHY